MDKQKCICIVCGNEYDTCACKSDERIGSWKKVCDTDNHYQIYLVINDYCYGNITKTKAKSMLGKLDVTGWEDFIPSVSKVIGEILGKTVATNDVVEETTVADTTKETATPTTDVDANDEDVIYLDEDGNEIV